MAQQTINNGDTGLSARTKINDNFTELYNGIGSSGKYNPTFTSVTNLDSTPTGTDFLWVRIGNIIHVSGRFTYDPTAGSTFSEFRLSLPVASNLASTNDCIGSGGDANNVVFEVLADITNNEAKVNFTSSGTGSSTASLMFSYEVL